MTDAKAGTKAETKTGFLDAMRSDYEAKYGFRDDVKPVVTLKPGLSEEAVREISRIKNEPEWLLNFRLKALRVFNSKPMPTWGGDLSKLAFGNITYYIRPSDRSGRTWEEVPESIKRTFDRLGIPEAEKKFLGGVGVQYESEVVYHKIKEDLEKQGVIFVDPDTAFKEHEDVFRKFFGTVVPIEDNKFAALNSAVFSGGSFIYVPEGVKVDMPLQAYFRINAQNMGQFERTLIIADKGASVNYIEGCTAPVYSTDSLHSAVVELIALEGAKIRYTTIQNWSNNVYNLVTKRAQAHKDAVVEWIDANIGCLTGNTKVFLNSDVKNISEVEHNDVLFAADQNMNLQRYKVLGKKYSGKQKTYRLLTQNQREIKATASHPFFALQKRGKFTFASWIPLEKLQRGDLVAISGDLPDSGTSHKITFERVKRTKISIKVPEETDEDLMWMLGVYIGDGYTDRTRVYFAVPKSDPANKKLSEIIKNKIQVGYEQKGVVLRINSANFASLIKSLGFSGNARQKRVPSWIYTLPRSQRLAFIDGYIAADGYARKGHKNVSITSCNKELLEDIKILAMACGLNPMKISRWSRKEKKALGKEKKEYTHYFLYFGEGKFNRPIAFVPVSDISYAGEEDTWDIEVDGAHNFIANGFLVHNSKLTMKYPSVYMVGPGARADILSVAFAGRGQHQDAGGKAVHLAPNTKSTIVSKSISKDTGRTSYRGLVHVAKGATGCQSNVRCDALLLDETSRSDTYPYMEIDEENVTIGHEATVGKIGEDQIFYLMSRGLKESEALAMIVLGFMEQFTKELPMEYAVELNRLIQLEMEGSVG